VVKPPGRSVVKVTQCRERSLNSSCSSPVATIHAGVQCLRRRLDRPEWPRDFDVLNEYAAAGATDYVLLQLEFSDRSRHCVTFTTDRPGGFTTAELSLVSDLLPYMSAFTEIQNVGYLATTLLDTYIGHHAGERIMQGTIRRGTGEVIHAVIWLCDMRGFTALSEQRPLAEVIEILNAYFDCVGIAVRKHGGEILKFIGDAMLAIFPVRGQDDGDAALRAVAAAREAVSSSRDANSQREAAGQATFQIGISVHVGDVMFGNIGAPHRLDFTVIGPAVNMAARLGALCSTLDKPVLLSEDVARALAAGATVPLGRFPLRGIEGERAVFGLGGM